MRASSPFLFGLLALTAALSGCSTISGPANEEFRQEPNKTVYRSTDRSSADGSPTVAPRQKIPGE